MNSAAFVAKGAGFVELPLVGVPWCKKCRSVGTIVDMKLCCTVAALVARGPLWDVPASMLLPRKGKRRNG